MKQIKFMLWVLIIVLFGASASIFAQDATEEPDMMAEVTEVPQFDSQGYIRFGHFVPGAEAVDVYVGGEISAEDVAYANLSEWMVVEAGNYEVAITPAGDTPDNTLLNASVDIVPDNWLTVGVLQSGENITVSLTQQDITSGPPSTAQASFANFLSTDEPLNFIRDEVVFIANLPVTTGQEFVNNSIGVDSRTYVYNIASANDETNMLVEGIEVDTVDTSAYFIGAFGTLDEPQLLIDETPRWKINLLEGELAAPGTLLQAAQTDPQAVPFIEAVQQAGLTDLITGEGPITIFAPADYLFDDVNLSGEELATVLRNHIVEGDFKAGDFFLGEPPTLTTIDGNNLPITGDGLIGDAEIIEVNLVGSNGTIHIINNFLMP